MERGIEGEWRERGVLKRRERWWARGGEWWRAEERMRGKRNKEKRSQRSMIFKEMRVRIIKKRGERSSEKERGEEEEEFERFDRRNGVK